MPPGSQMNRAGSRKVGERGAIVDRGDSIVSRSTATQLVAVKLKSTEQSTQEAVALESWTWRQREQEAA